MVASILLVVRAHHIKQQITATKNTGKRNNYLLAIDAAQEALAPGVSTDALRHVEKIQSTQIDLLAIDAAQEALAPGVSTDALQHLAKSTVDSD